jgi:hypothetical protein
MIRHTHTHSKREREGVVEGDKGKSRDIASETDGDNVKERGKML